MGEVTENIHTFALPNESQPYTFKMKYRYDSWKICASRMKRKLVFCSEAQPNLRVANRVQSEIKENILVVLNQYAAGAQASPHSEDECYWYHPDHLGSASWVTDTNGTAYQHLQYMPWGEPLLDQRKSGYTYNTRYTFSGKERDEETGYSYFGARYYHSDLSIWLSVDPMADKYPGTSPYTYCANNPIVLKDPNGDSLINPYRQAVINAQEQYNRAASQNIPDLSHEKNMLEDAMNRCYYVDQFIKGLSDEQYNALDNIKDEHGNPINIYICVDYDLKTVAANRPQWTKEKRLRNNKLFIYINPFRDENNKESNIPISNWLKVARHEGGHAYYIIRQCVKYFDWLVENKHINKQGKPLHNYNGHGKGDKSAEHAGIWEAGGLNLIND